MLSIYVVLIAHYNVDSAVLHSLEYDITSIIVTHMILEQPKVRMVEHAKNRYNVTIKINDDNRPWNRAQLLVVPMGGFSGCDNTPRVKLAILHTPRVYTPRDCIIARLANKPPFP